MNTWQSRHFDDMAKHPIGRLITAWADYADWMEQDLGWKIGNDSVLGEPWAEIGRAIQVLLNGDIGNIDGGSAWRHIEAYLEEYEAAELVD